MISRGFFVGLAFWVASCDSNQAEKEDIVAKAGDVAYCKDSILFTQDEIVLDEELATATFNEFIDEAAIVEAFEEQILPEFEPLPE
ncbi:MULTISPECIES: hypothetical protein [Hyphomonas]